MRLDILIDEQYQYIYIENPKTASYSIKHALMGAENVHNPYDPRIGTVSHELPTELKLRYPQQWQNYNKFVVVRNTWDRAASFFAFATSNNFAPSMAGVTFQDWVLAGCPAPEEDLFSVMLRAYEGEPRPLCQLKYIEEVDEIIVLTEFDAEKRSQQLLDGLQNVANTFGFPLQALPEDKNHSGRKHNPLCWTTEMVARVQSVYAEEIERFSFEAPEIN